MFVVDVIYIYFGLKLSDNILNEFFNDFGYELKINSVKYNKYGIKVCEYSCDHILLKNYRDHLSKWLTDQDFPVNYTILCNDISLYCSTDLSDTQIKDFEDEFEVTCLGYLISCGCDDVEYNFG